MAFATAGGRRSVLSASDSIQKTSTLTAIEPVAQSTSNRLGSTGDGDAHPFADVLKDERHDPDLLDKIGTVKYKPRRWSLGDSGDLVEGRSNEPFWVSLAWVVVPLLGALTLLYFMFQIGGQS